MEARIDIPVIAGDAPKVEDQTNKRKYFKEQKDSSQVQPKHCRFREFENGPETNDCPHRQKENYGSPKQERSPVPTRAGRRGGLSRVGLACPRIERSRIGASSLLIEDWGSHDVRGSALLAFVKIQLRYGCHSVVLDLATPCDTGPSIEILARLVQIGPHSRTGGKGPDFTRTAKVAHTKGDRLEFQSEPLSVN